MKLISIKMLKCANRAYQDIRDFLTFYVLFEVLGFPMFLLIGQYGPRPQRVNAAYKFFVYTFGGSAFILPVLVYLQFWLGSTEVFFLRGVQFTEYEQALFFGLCAVPFGVKIPVVPLHLWLPEAHVEAPTPISMLLAGLLLKTGGYAFIRFLLPVFPHGAKESSCTIRPSPRQRGRRSWLS